MNRRVAILGCGKIGESLLGGLLSAGWREPAEVVASCRREERAGELRGHYGIEATLANGEAAAGAGLVVVAVKPQDFEALLGEIGPLLAPGADRALGRRRDPHRADRGAASRPTSRSSARCRTRRRSSTRGSPASAPAPTPREEHLALAEECLTHLGAVVRVPEPYMDAVTAVSGSGPAYFALLAEAMIEAGHPARALARGDHAARRPDDARHREAPPRRAHAPGRAARGGHLAGRDDDPRDPRARGAPASARRS